jgi:hypothetical protein
LTFVLVLQKLSSKKNNSPKQAYTTDFARMLLADIKDASVEDVTPPTDLQIRFANNLGLKFDDWIGSSKSDMSKHISTQKME